MTNIPPLASHSLKVILGCSKRKAAALCQLHVSYIRVALQWRSYVRNISWTGPNEFSLPFTQQRRLQVQKADSPYRGETRQMALTTGRQTHGLTDKQIEKERTAERKKEGGRQQRRARLTE